jgi:hypothetical protein
MLDHFRSELLRYRAWAIAFATLHLMVLASSPAWSTSRSSLPSSTACSARCMRSAACCSALYQMGNYRKPECLAEPAAPADRAPAPGRRR